MLGPVLYLVIASLLATTSIAAADSPSDLDLAPTSRVEFETTPELLDRVARDPIWRALLHQARHSISGPTRDAFVDVDFFYHPEGSTRPDLELIATRDAFVDADPDRARQARCRFPARFQFLIERGVLPDTPRGICPELDDWRRQIGEIELTLIFPEAFLGNPASMFGHTLLRFDRIEPAQIDSDEPLLGWTLDYVADAQGDGGLSYLIRGLSGRYRGKFGIAPYYEKTKLYSDWQDRDIWEYPLSMSRLARERVLLHVWEIQDLALPYYFFTQNCSEKLLEVLEVGSPDLGRGGGFPPVVAPIDTLRAAGTGSPEALGTPHLRPSPASRLQDALGALDRPTYAAVEALAEGRLTPEDERLDAFSDETRARVLSLAYDLLRHSYLAGKVSDEDSRSRSLALLRARGRIGGPTASDGKLVHLDRGAPDQGHGTARAMLGGGIQDRDGFIELRLLPAYHTMIDAPGGFAEGGEIRVLETAVRYYPELDRVRLHELVPLDITSASPWRRPFRPLAWHGELGLRTRLVSDDRGRGLKTASIFRAQGGIGAALAPAPRLHLYSFAEIVLEAGPSIEANAAAGPLARAGLSWSTTRGGYTIRVEGLAGALIGRDPSAWLGGRLEQRISLTRNWSAVLGGQYDRAYHVGHFEGRLALIRYF